MTDKPSARPSATAIFRVSLKLGLIAFGGPTAHLGYFREEFVRRKKWLTDEAYSDLVALSQFLPGPASSQTIFAIGMRQRGWTGALLASAGFTLPSAILMIAFAYGVGSIGQLDEAGWLKGLKLAAVAVVAKAVWEMSRQLCPDSLRRCIAIAVAALLILSPNLWLQLGTIIGGAVIGCLAGGKKTYPTHANSPDPAKPPRQALLSLALFVALLIGLPLASSLSSSHGLALFDSFYRSGSIVFGGGHVVLPLLRSEVVPPGWVGDNAFLAGYGAVQAVPGPLFTFASYLGTLASPEKGGWLGGLLCLAAIFLPGWLLMAGALPFWDRLRRLAAAQAALRGANAAVVGILAAALYAPVATSSISHPGHLIVAITGFALLKWTKCPPWLWVLLAAGAGPFLA